MRYVSTRGAAAALGFEDVVLAGLARDGGLYVPESWPAIAPDELRRWESLSYADVAVEVMRPFVDGISEDDFAAIVHETYAVPGVFHQAAVTPLRQLDAGEWLLELFHGPTLAFKDVALQLLGRLFEHILKKRGERITVVGATSGDTGSAAIEACRDRENVTIFMLHPHGRVSEVQRRQMTSVPSANVYNIAVQGTFDDCQALVKAMFNDHAFRDRLNLAAVNSINWARVLAQVVYYFQASLALGGHDGRRIDFSVPTGNFGDVFAGYVASRMGAPVNKLIVATNVNDILSRALRSGDYSRGTVQPTISPSMDIQVSSNFERLLFDLYGGDGARIAALMDDFAATGRLAIGNGQVTDASRLFAATRIDEDETRATIAHVLRHNATLIDPHTAVGVAAGRKLRTGPEVPLVSLATAHPAKFPDAVQAASGIYPGLPPHLADLLTRPERYEILPNDLKSVQDHIGALTQ
ncbi:threonine synthase [Iodidimonas sp. SYSU 1G8]|uniref:threonine synthase n=1 Tax=Iodidimonas sp. SYSU 1G8 TaxID=3133967 RepID=UPI0031FE8D58